MSDANSTPGQNAGNGQADDDAELKSPMLRVLAQYAKDLSFENPGPMVVQGSGAPEIELGIDVRVEPGNVEEHIYGVDLRLSGKAKRAEQIVFIIELTYSGVFQLQDARPQDIEPLLLIECPRLLFPFARRVIAEMTREGGHPPLLIDPIDFAGLYRKQRSAQQNGETAQA
jgi:preprotein translocase subunit SecB